MSALASISNFISKGWCSDFGIPFSRSTSHLNSTDVWHERWLWPIFFAKSNKSRIIDQIPIGGLQASKFKRTYPCMPCSRYILLQGLTSFNDKEGLWASSRLNRRRFLAIYLGVWGRVAREWRISTYVSGTTLNSQFRGIDPDGEPTECGV